MIDEREAPGDLSETMAALAAGMRRERVCACGKGYRGLGSACPECFELARREAWKRAARVVVESVQHTLPLAFRDVALDGAGLERLTARISRPSAVAEAREIVSRGAGCVLVGPSASGKTTLGAAMLLAHAVAMLPPIDDEDAEQPGESTIWDLAGRCRYVRSLSIATARLQTGAGNGEAAVVLSALAAPVLLLDDLGLEPVSPTTIEILLERGDNMQPTIVTTALEESDDLVGRYGEGVARRLFARAHVVKTWGAS